VWMFRSRNSPQSSKPLRSGNITSSRIRSKVWSFNSSHACATSPHDFTSYPSRRRRFPRSVARESSSSTSNTKGRAISGHLDFCGKFGARIGGRKEQPELAAVRNSSLEFDPAPMRLHGALHDRQAQATTSLPRLARRGSTVERLKYSGDFVLRNAWSAI